MLRKLRLRQRMIFLYQKRVDNKKLKWSKGATCSQTNA